MVTLTSRTSCNVVTSNAQAIDYPLYLAARPNQGDDYETIQQNI